MVGYFKNATNTLLTYFISEMSNSMTEHESLTLVIPSKCLIGNCLKFHTNKNFLPNSNKIIKKRQL